MLRHSSPPHPAGGRRAGPLLPDSRTLACRPSLDWLQNKIKMHLRPCKGGRQRQPEVLGGPGLRPSHWPLPRAGASTWPPRWAPQGRSFPQRPSVALPSCSVGAKQPPHPGPRGLFPKARRTPRVSARLPHRPPSTGPLPRKSRPGSGQDVTCSREGLSWQVGCPCPQAAIHQGHTQCLCLGKREPQSTFSWLSAMNLVLS